MKTNREPAPFTPITITLETIDELEILQRTIRSSGFRAILGPDPVRRDFFDVLKSELTAYTDITGDINIIDARKNLNERHF